jgi:hypothetical protein
MMHCLHVLSTEADFQSRRGAETLAGSRGTECPAQIKTIGRGGTWRSVPFAAAGLRRHDLDLVHAWDMESLAAAALANVRKIVFTPPALPTPRSARWLRLILAHRDVAVVCSSATARRAWVRSGVPEACCRMIRPGIDACRVGRQRDPKLRAALGFGDADHVLLAVGESTRAARHDYSIWAASILHVMDRNQRLLLWGRGATCDSTARLAIRIGHAELCAIAQRKLGRSVDFEELLNAADMALITADRLVSPLPIAICMAAKLPIVATDSPLIKEMLQDQRTALIAPPRVPRRIAQTITDLRTSPELQQALVDRAATQAGDLFGNERFVDQHHALYAQFVGGGGMSRTAGVGPIFEHAHR